MGIPVVQTLLIVPNRAARRAMLTMPILVARSGS
jgi:hypothetical protein